MPQEVFQPKQSEQLSKTFLDAKLGHHKALVFAMQKDASPTITLSALDDLHSDRLAFVVVGQAINITTLQTLYNTYFVASEYFIVKKHALHNAFGDQAYIIEVPSKFSEQLNTSTLLEISKHFFIDCFLVSDIDVNQPGLLVMDMDSTIIDMECIDEIAVIAGAGEKVSAITEKAMQGELDFNQSLEARVSCLTGLASSELHKLRSRLPINPGFASTIEYLHKRNWICCIASGGFTFFADYLKDTFNLYQALSNTLDIQDGKLTGKVSGQIVNGEMKREILLKIAKEKSIKSTQSIAIGDGANDLLMMSEAHLGVAYKAKLKVKHAADANICYCGFEGLLYALRH